MKTIYTDISDLSRGKVFTFLTDDIVASGTTLRVQSVVGFESLDTSSGQVVIIGELGNERTEIRRTSSATGPSASYKEITLRDALQFDHPQDTKVYITDFDRVEYKWAATINGTKATVATYPFTIRPDALEMSYVDSSAATGYFFTRFNRSIDNAYSDYSDPLPYGGYDDNTVFMVKKGALDELGEEIDGKTITHEFLNSALWDARREYHNAPGKRPFRRNYNQNIGYVSTGMYRIPLPTTVQSPFTSENVYGVRIGTNQNLSRCGKKEWDFCYQGIAHTALTTTYSIGARDLYVSNARDLQSSGSVNVGGATVIYSEKSNDGGTLRISTDGAWGSDNGTDVWQGASFGLPTSFTVWADPEGSAYIYFDCPLDTAYVGLNIYLDSYRTLVGYDSDADILDEPSYDMYRRYLMARIKHRRSRVQSDITQDSDFRLWMSQKNEALAKENLDTDISLFPDIGHLPLPN